MHKDGILRIKGSDQPGNGGVVLQTTRAQFKHPVPDIGDGRDCVAHPFERAGQLPPGIGRSFPEQVQDRIGRQQEQGRP